MFPLESARRGDSNKYTQYTIFITKKKKENHSKLSAATGLFRRGSRTAETAMVNEPSVFEPLNVYCICLRKSKDSVETNLFGNAIENLIKHGIHCLPCSATNDDIDLLW